MKVKPNKGYYVVQIAEDIRPKKTEVTKVHLEQMREDYIKAGKEMEVLGRAEDCDFAEVGSKILGASHARFQKVTLDEKKDEVVYLLRESDILCIVE